MSPSYSSAARKLSPELDEAIVIPAFSGHAVPASFTAPKIQYKEASIEIPAQNAQRRFNELLRLYAATDVIAMVLGFASAWMLAFAINALFLGREVSGLVQYNHERLSQLFVIGISVLLWFQHTGHYRMRMPFWLEIKKIVNALAFAMMVDGFLQFASKQDISRLWLISGWLFTGIFIVVLHALMRAILGRMGHWQVSTLLVGDGITAENALAALKSEPGLGYNVTARINNLPLVFIQEKRSWERICKAYSVEYIVIALDGRELAGAEEPIAQLMRETIPFSVSPPLRHLPVLGMVPQYFFNHDTMLLTRSSGLEQPLPRFIKRMVDILISGSALLVLSPLMLVIAALVRRDGAPAFFGHMRIGHNGKLFPCFKFRSMAVNSDEILKRALAQDPMANAEWQQTQKLKNDPRVTKIGRFLRRSSLDELPQLINVLRGEMSLVGPRPIVASEIAKYNCDIAHYYSVRPGVTGLWQVSGRNDVTYAQRVQMDSWYVRNWSLWHDIAILCKTFPALLNRNGAY